MWVIIVCAIYGLKISRASFRSHLANNLQTMGFKPTFADQNMWVRKNFLPLPQKLNNSVGSDMGTDTTML